MVVKDLHLSPAERPAQLWQGTSRNRTQLKGPRRIGVKLNSLKPYGLLCSAQLSSGGRQFCFSRLLFIFKFYATRTQHQILPSMCVSRITYGLFKRRGTTNTTSRNMPPSQFRWPSGNETNDETSYVLSGIETWLCSTFFMETLTVKEH